MNPDSSTSDAAARLKIGAVARLTGLSVHTLRKWEERYHAVVPGRTSSGGRLYSRQDVRRLALIKRLTHAGLPLGEVAGKSLAELESMVDAVADQHTLRSDEQPRRIAVAVLGNALPAVVERGGLDGERIEVVASAADVARLRTALDGRAVEVLVMESPTVHGSSAARVHEAMSVCAAGSAAVVYAFASDAALAALRQHGFALLRAPVNVDQVELAILQLAHQPPRTTRVAEADDALDPAPPPRFSMHAIRLAALSAPAMRCECPHHLADLLFSLRAFERYSVECESASEVDAELHRYLAHLTGHARASFESALARVAAAEGLTLEEGSD